MAAMRPQPQNRLDTSCKLQKKRPFLPIQVVGLGRK